VTRRRLPIGILGGTFDPVHFGHLGLARWVRAYLGLPRAVLLPAAVPPHKRHEFLSPARHREAMLNLALAAESELELCTVELESGGVCYTIDTLRALRDGPPVCDPLFILGTDSLLEIPTWHQFRDLVREFDLVAIDREEAGLERIRERLDPDLESRLIVPVDRRSARAAVDRGRPGGRILCLGMEPIPISSTEVRRRAAEGRSLVGLVPPAVARYIQSNGLYRQEEKR
jgi:nicotinate-nucleotide adenylyltransferase